MYIYIIKYNGEIIAATDDDMGAEFIIQEYCNNNKDMQIGLFDKVPVRFFSEKTDERRNSDS